MSEQRVCYDCKHYQGVPFEEDYGECHSGHPDAIHGLVYDYKEEEHGYLYANKCPAYEEEPDDPG